MSDEDPSDDSFLERHHHLMHLYRNPLLTSTGRRGSGGALVALLLVGWGLYLLIAEYWQSILLALLALAGVCAIVVLILISYAKPRETGAPAPSPSQQAATAIRNTISSTPKLGRYAWSAYDGVLLEQWQRFAATGVTPPRRKTLARKERKATERDKPTATAPLGRKAQAALAEIEASPKLAQHAWRTDESGLLEQWQRYQTLGQLPVRRSKLAKRLASATGSDANG